MQAAKLTAQNNFGFRAPTRAEYIKTYSAIVEKAQSDRKLKPLASPPVAEPWKYPHYDITPAGLQDVHKTVYVIKGELYLQTSSLFGPRPGGTSSWQKVGLAPRF
jgi:hypothetical protein